MRCSAKRSGAVRRRSGTATDSDDPRKSGMPDLRAFKCRSRVNPRSVSAAHHFASLVLRCARDTFLNSPAMYFRRDDTELEARRASMGGPDPRRSLNHGAACRMGPFDHIAVKGVSGLNAGNTFELHPSL